MTMEFKHISLFIYYLILDTLIFSDYEIFISIYVKLKNK